MSYGGQSNAPWQRNAMQGHPEPDGFHQGSQMFMQNNMAAFGHGGMQDGGNAFLAGGGNSVAYPQQRSNLNPVAFQQNVGGQSHYNSIGTVTKISIDCGLVNDEVFFYRNVCRGPEPKLGDRVIFEATYSNNGQFKWNATRVQLMPQAPHVMSSNKASYSSVAPPNDYQRGQIRRNSPKRSPVRGRRERERLHRSRDRDELKHEPKRRREDHDRSRDRGAVANRVGGHAAARNEKDRGRAESRKKEREVADLERAEREKERARELEVQRVGAKGKRPRHVKRYMIDIPKSLLAIKTAGIQDLRRRYSSLYIPSDFFLANVKWSDAFTLENPFSLRRPCQFHIMHEMVENFNDQKPDLLEPADASYLYTAKVMLMSLPPIAELYKKCFDNGDDDNDHHAVHPSRLINFLVGVKGRVGSMAIGGPWSPSLDGENPEKDPSVLIRTAIRTCKALTGIDLSNCTQWYRFVELYYHRTEYKNMEKDGPPRVETVVIYLPDVHSCMPSIQEWQTMTQVYKNAADDVIARRKALVEAAAANTNEDDEKSQDIEMADNSTANDDEAAAEEEEAQETSVDNEANDDDVEDNGEADKEIVLDDDDDDDDDDEEQEENMDDSTATADVSGAADNDDDAEEEGADTVVGQPAADDEMAEEENDEPAPEPTHYSLLDLKTMKVQEMRDELMARNLPEKGVRNVIMARLAKALNAEKAEEKQSHKQVVKNPAAVKKSQETNKKPKQNEKSNADAATGDKKAADKKTPNDKKAHDKKDAKTTKQSNNKKSARDDKEDFVFEMDDMVIVDEYDSNKSNEESNLKAMTEKEKSQLIRHYTLPTAPHIVVHPNRQAKGGKFDCAVVSLSVLLDYHPDDSKERFFEVSLFAELFNDMLIRDFGFNIYKEIYLHKPTEAEIAEQKKENEAKAEKTESGEENKKDAKEKDNEKEKTSKKDSKSSNGDKSGKEHKTEDENSNKSETRKRKLSTSTATANGKDHDVPANDKKMVVVKPQLLLSFVYFDTNHCGYIMDKHLEDLFYILGLNLSRSQIKKVLANLSISATTNAIHYRKLTDKEATLESTPAIEDIDDLPLETLERIAAGNNIYESVFARDPIQNQVAAIGGDEGDTKDGLINFNGTVVHVGKLLHQINRTEKNLSDVEKIHNDLLKQHTDLQKDHNKTTTKMKELQTEIKSVSRKLNDANQDFYSLNRKYRDQHATLSYIYTRVTPYFVREKDKDGKAEKDKDAKSEKDKDAKSEKDKDAKSEKDKDAKSEKDKDTTKEKDKTNQKENEKEKEKEKPKEEKDKEVKKEKTKEEQDKEVVKDEKEKPKEEKEKPKDDKEKPKEEKEKPKEEKEKEKEKPKEEIKIKQPEKVVKVAVKDKQAEKVADNKADADKKEKLNKETIKIENNKPTKPKPTATGNQAKPTPQKTTAAAKAATPTTKKLSDNKTPAKVIKKSDNAGAKK